MALRFSFALTLCIALVSVPFQRIAYASDQPHNGGTIRFTAPYSSTFTGLDILASARNQDEIWGKAVHRALYNWDAKNSKPVLELADSVSVSDDGLTYTYKLRDAHFHNGRKLTADDIIWTYNHIMDGSKAYPGARYVRLIKGAVQVEKAQAKAISGLRKIDDQTLEMTLTERADPGYYFYNARTSIYPAKEAQEPAFASHPIGLGPYKFEEYVPGSRLVVARWDRFYKEGLPHADKIIIALMGEASARDVAFRNREIDQSILGPEQYVAYKADPELSKGLIEVAEVYTRAMGLNTNHKPFADKRVRQAISYAINADLIIKRLVKDKAFRATSLLPLSSPAYDKDMKPYPYDPDKARKLLTEAGYDNGFEFEITATSNESWGIPILEAVIPMLAKVGIKARIKPVDVSVLAELVSKGDYQAFMWVLNTGPDALVALKCFHSATPQPACNYTAYNNPEVDDLLNQAGSAGDQEKALKDLGKVNAILREDAPYWFFNYNKAVMAYQPWLHGLQPNATELAVQNYEELWVDETSPAAK